MLTNERHEIIMNILKEKQTITIQDAADATGASDSTIRRDLTELEKKEKLERIHGGAVLPDRKLQEYSISEKSAKNLQEKKAIAKYASSLVKRGDCISLDAGTTTLQMIPFLKHKDAVVVTNGLTHLDALMENDITTYLTGGIIKVKTSALIGPQTIQSLKNYRFDKCFLGVNGFHPEYGYTTPDPEEASIKETARTLSKKSYVVADHSKLNKVSFAKISELSDCSIITGELPQHGIGRLAQLTEIKEITP